MRVVCNFDILTRFLVCIRSYKLLCFLFLICFYNTSLFAQIDQLIQNQIDKAEAFKDQEKYEEAYDLVLQTLNEYPAANCLSKGNLLHKTGTYLYDLYRDNEALDYWQQALDIRKKCTSTPLESIANSHFNIALLLDDNNPQKAFHHRESINILTALPKKDTLDIAYKCTFIAELYIDLGDIAIANSYLMQAMRYYESVDSPPNADIAEMYNMISILRNKEKKHAEAIIVATRGVELLKATPKNEALLTNLYQNIFKAQLHLKKFVKAEEVAKNILRLSSTLNDTLKISNGYENLGFVNMHKDEYQQAIDFFTKSLNLRQATTANYSVINIANAHENIADVYVLKKDFENAFQHYQTAIQYLAPNFKSTSPTDNPDISKVIIDKLSLIRILSLKALAFSNKYETEKKQTDLASALQTIQLADRLINQTRQSFRATGSKYQFVQTTKPIYERGIEIAMSLYQLTDNKDYHELAYHFSAKNKAIVLLDDFQNNDAIFKHIPAKIIQQERQLREQYYKVERILSSLTNQSNKLNLYNDSLFILQRKYEKFINQLETNYPEYYQLKYAYQQQTKLSTIQKKLPEDAAVIEYFIGDANIYCFVISKNEFNVYSQQIPIEFQKSCKAFSQAQAIDRLFTKTNYAPLALQLYEWLLEKPLDNISNKIDRLFIIPDDILLQISFDSFFSKKAKRWQKKIDRWDRKNLPYLVYDYALSYAYSIELLIDNNKRKKVSKNLIPFGGFGLDFKKFNAPNLDSYFIQTETTAPNRRDKLTQLYHSIEEVEQLANMYDGDLFVNESATKKSFQTNASRYQVLHIATHGFIDQSNPQNSALFFHADSNHQDFALKALDLYNTTLHATLAFLSGCNTASGKIKQGEGVRSLSRAFAYAGCPSIVASLWSIPDNPFIPVRFHQYLTQGMKKDRALQQAKIDYLQSDAINLSPSHWSPLILIGDPSPLDKDVPFNWMVLAIVSIIAIFLYLFWRSSQKNKLKENYFVD